MVVLLLLFLALLLLNFDLNFKDEFLVALLPTTSGIS